MKFFVFLFLFLHFGCNAQTGKRLSSEGCLSRLETIVRYNEYRSSRISYDIEKEMPLQLICDLHLGRISQYDSLFKKNAAYLKWDWTLLASLSFQESRFVDTVRSGAGACGLMGIMPATAASFDISEEELFEPAINIGAAVKVLRRFRHGFPDVRDSLQLVKLTLAAYNAGLGHVQDACRLAEKYDESPYDWDRSVSRYIILKSDPAYYTDSVCRYGYLHGRQVFHYVREVINRQRFYKQCNL